MNSGLKLFKLLMILKFNRCVIAVDSLASHGYFEYLIIIQLMGYQLNIF